jgi:hypothetical protein
VEVKILDPYPSLSSSKALPDVQETVPALIRKYIGAIDPPRQPGQGFPQGLVERRKEVKDVISPIAATQIANYPFQELADEYKASVVGRQRGFKTKIDRRSRTQGIFPA